MTEQVTDFETVFSVKEKRLPKGVRTHIRKLKESGKLEEALRFAKTYRQKEKNRAPFNLDQAEKLVVAEIIEETQPVKVAVAALKLVWINSSIEREELSQRVGKIDEVYELNKEFETVLDAALPAIRDQYSKLPLV